MRTLIAIAALVVNVVALGALHLSALPPTPNGEVSITQLADAADVAAYARSSSSITPSYRLAKAL